MLDSAVTLHLEDHLDSVNVESADVPEIREEVEWKFDEPRPEWTPLRMPASPGSRGRPSTQVTAMDDAMRITVTGRGGPADP